MAIIFETIYPRMVKDGKSLSELTPTKDNESVEIMSKNQQLLIKLTNEPKGYSAILNFLDQKDEQGNPVIKSLNKLQNKEDLLTKLANDIPQEYRVESEDLDIDNLSNSEEASFDSVNTDFDNVAPTYDSPFNEMSSKDFMGISQEDFNKDLEELKTYDRKARSIYSGLPNAEQLLNNCLAEFDWINIYLQDKLFPKLRAEWVDPTPAYNRFLDRVKLARTPFKVQTEWQKLFQDLANLEKEKGWKILNRSAWDRLFETVDHFQQNFKWVIDIVEEIVTNPEALKRHEEYFRKDDGTALGMFSNFFSQWAKFFINEQKGGQEVVNKLKELYSELETFKWDLSKETFDTVSDKILDVLKRFKEELKSPSGYALWLNKIPVWQMVLKELSYQEAMSYVQKDTREMNIDFDKIIVKKDENGNRIDQWHIDVKKPKPSAEIGGLF